MTIGQNRKDSLWWIYAKATLFLLPPIAVFGVAVIFVLPKIKQMCADVGYDPRAFFAPMDFFVQQGGFIFLSMLALLFVAEKWSPTWPRYRAAVVACVVYFMNSAVLVGLTSMLFIAAMVGPAMARLR